MGTGEFLFVDQSLSRMINVQVGQGRHAKSLMKTRVLTGYGYINKLHVLAVGFGQFVKVGRHCFAGLMVQRGLRVVRDETRHKQTNKSHWQNAQT